MYMLARYKLIYEQNNKITMSNAYNTTGSFCGTIYKPKVSYKVSWMPINNDKGASIFTHGYCVREGRVMQKET